MVVRAVFARLLPGTDDAPGGVDDGTPAILLEGILYILGGAALGPVAGHQQEGVGHPGAELLQLLRISSPGHRAGPGIAVLPFSAGSPLLNEVGHKAVDGVSLPGGYVLELAGAGVGGLGQDKHALVPLPRHL